MQKSAILALTMMVVAAGEAAAQSNGVFRAPASHSAGPRQAVQTRRDTVRPPSAVLAPGQQPTAVPVAAKLIPAVIMSDGTIMADFGFGLEPVRRACQTVQAGGNVIIGGGQVIGRVGMQPAPAQQTQSQQMSAAAQRQQSRASLGSCFTRDASGRVFILQ